MSRTEAKATASRSGKAARTPKQKALSERSFTGTAIYPGIAIGPVAMATETPAPVITRRIEADAEPAEQLRLNEAVARSLKQLDKLRARLSQLPEETQLEISPLLDAYRQMLGPSRLLRGARRRIQQELASAEASVLDEAEALATRLQAPAGAAADTEDAAAANRRADEVREIARRLVRNLTNAPYRSFANLPPGTVLVAEQLRPADAALIDPSRIVGVATDEGGDADHTAIMLRALGIPSVLGAAGVAAAARAGALAVVDGTTGTIVLDARPATLAEARRGVASYARTRQKLARLRRLPAELSSGERVELQANMEIPAELPLIAQSGAAGIGLLRTEFLFINAETLPDEFVQERVYREVIEAMGEDCTTIRVLDWGGEKQSEALGNAGFFSGEVDLNPALGLRGLRLLLMHPTVLETQFAAILRASVAGPTRILLPMVTSLGELRTARDLYERLFKRLRRKGVRLPERPPPLGVMIETPAAAISAEALALEADFLAIGTNDLTMYTLAVDRSAAAVARLYDPLHPAVIRLIAETTAAALRLRRPVSLCGEIAGNPRVVPLLMGLGLRSFSMNASAVPRVKQAVRAVSLDECRRFARRVSDEVDPERIARLVDEFSA
ncbi:phosphoenolpyruvate--protein phosphotransferase [Lichenicoccus roseus]|uniref:Phosphoenolpyruvate-protein phosphotransferase n=1 Tax=Lichenicoccus roseus TaxID=2683649 RepID=A0A5R9J2K9_9PROT|nr:phosphoenolpyruvate--protein phosphotransferase [Lichenicoccus roseus]TLU71870.1 phosphoenolpyruvate--protein phosphotransferase [Lichenicoccus roseus]